MTKKGFMLLDSFLIIFILLCMVNLVAFEQSIFGRFTMNEKQNDKFFQQMSETLLKEKYAR